MARDGDVGGGVRPAMRLALAAPLFAVLLFAACGDIGPSGLEDPAGTVAVIPRGDRLDGGSGPSDAAPLDLGTADPAVAFASPTEGQSYARSGIDMGDWVAFVDVTLSVAGVAAVEVQVDGSARERIELPAASESLTLTLRGDGPRTLTAVGLDDAGLERARDQVAITVTPPDDGSCHAMLDALGLDWEVSGPQRGIADPVYVQPYFRSVAYRYVSNDAPTRLLMDCELAPRLYRLAEVLEEHGIDEAIHIGIYNYRCIGGGDPDSGTCTPSQHAYARAIDLWGFGLAGSDTEYVLERDWIITSGPTCPGTATGEADRVLHEVGCRMYEDAIFQTILTPNYNADHRNHFHVDMTEGRMFIESIVTGIDPDVPGLGH